MSCDTEYQLSQQKGWTRCYNQTQKDNSEHKNERRLASSELDITTNSNAIPGDWKKAVVVLLYKGGDRSVVGNYRPGSWTSGVCKQLEHVLAGYLRQVWEMGGWLFKGQYVFRLGYSCKSQVGTVYQDIADSLDEWYRTGARKIHFSKAFDLVPHDRLLMQIAVIEDLRVVGRVIELLLGRSQRDRVDTHLSEEVRVNSGLPQGSVIGPYGF
jgi:hypothetical protein